MLLFSSVFLAGCGVGYIVCLVVLFYPFLNNPFNDEKFNQAVWLQYHKSDDWNNPRGKMAEDLKKKILKAKMSRQEVLNMLGPPDFREEKVLLSYDLGMWSGFRIDGDSFDVYFDSSDHVEEILIVQH